LELVLADRDELDLDVGLPLEPVDDRLGGLDPVGVVLSGPEREGGAAGPGSASAAANDCRQEQDE
jgi:hypothetical protein